MDNWGRMELLLLSSMDGDHPVAAITELKQRLGKTGLRAGYIASEPDPDKDYFKPVREWYAGLEIEMATFLELEQGYDTNIIDALFDNDLIHLSGGNTFRFLYWLKHRNLLPKIIDFASRGGALVGLSAGAIILTADISSAVVCGDANDIGLQHLTGATLCEFQLVPHLPVTDNMAWLQQAALFTPVALLHDGDALRLQGQEWVSYGSPVWLFG
ncbi:Type 1 glutamine amidotransferase-like domain-containing protein [Shewanella sp. GXUN23E]|uniref:Type 1 glutamine amidotransferase-like domain-containing protein n=1 Tax=Shewanella sp. GXUN23E TaxID=3422498 RepID=UPI003D7C9652